jgi:hypothetical protein
MARLPQPGSDDGQWGNILNDFLSQVHNSDGSLRDGSVVSGTIADGAVSSTTLAPAGGSDGDVLVQDATSSTGMTWATPPSGTATLSGDVTGPTSATVLANGAVTSAKLANGAVDAGKMSISGTPATNNLISWNGTQLAWVSPSASSAALDDLTDVSTTGAASGNVLGYNGTNWAPTTVAGGSDTYNFKSVNSNTTAVDRDFLLVDSSGGLVTITLPASVAGRKVAVKQMSNSGIAARVVAASGFIDAASEGATDIDTQYQTVVFVCDGTNWYRIW